MASSGTDTHLGMLEPPPPGETVDRTHPESIASRLIVTCLLCPAITLIFCAIRLYTASCIVRKVRLDDCELQSGMPSRPTPSCLPVWPGMITVSLVRLDTQPLGLLVLL